LISLFVKEVLAGTNGKGCDIGYALAACSCEGADNVGARTVTALDAITAFAVPDPGGFLAKPSVFSGPDATLVAQFRESLSLLRVSNGLISLSLSTVDARDTNSALTNVNTQELCNSFFFGRAQTSVQLLENERPMFLAREFLPSSAH
jgi:hypothetical protein